VTNDRFRVFFRIAIVASMLVLAPAAIARQATPVATSPGITLAASGIDNPRGFAWAADGTLFVAEAGAVTAAADGGTPAASGEIVGTLSGSVVQVSDGCPVTYQGSLPSSGGNGGIDLGPSDLAFVGGQLHVLDDGGGANHGNPNTPSGVYAIDGSGSARLVADIGAWVAGNPVANPPAELDPDGDPFAMVASGGSLWVTEHNSGQLLKVDADGTISQVADFSATDQIPTGLTVAADGSLYVALLAGGSFGAGASSIINVALDGTMAEAWTGLTAVTSVALAQDGTLFALEMGSGGADDLASVERNSGRVVRQTGPDDSREVATGFDAPLAMAFGPDLGLYVSSPSSSQVVDQGSVVRLDTNQGQVLTIDADLLTTSPCFDQPTPPPSLASPGASPSAGDSTPASSSGPAVDIKGFAFGPASLTVSVGDTVTWTNNDAVAHTVTATGGAFDSGTVSPGDTFTFTFTTAGSFEYVCSFHPNMTGTIVVQ